MLFDRALDQREPGSAPGLVREPEIDTDTLFQSRKERPQERRVISTAQIEQAQARAPRKQPADGSTREPDSAAIERRGPVPTERLSSSQRDEGCAGHVRFGHGVERSSERRASM